MRPLSALVLGCALLLPARAAAQDTTRATPPSAGRMAAARELLEVVHLQEVSAMAVKLGLEQQVRANPMLEPYRATMIEWGTELFASEEANTAFATLYANTFSEEDLRALIAFYRTPLGQRLASSQVVLYEKGAQLGRSLAEAHQAELVERIQRVTPKP